MGLNVLKYTRDTSLWFAEYSGPWKLRVQRVQLKKSCGCAYHTSPFPVIKITYNIEFSNRIWMVGERRQNDDNLLHKTNFITYDIIYDIIIIWYDIIYDII